tara:strand:+ start:6866 stop:7513 length:648 start_codon:yes stop_codon:yes gene_type:complete
MAITYFNYPFNEHHLPQRGITPETTSGARTWLVDLATAKEHLRIGHTDDDTYITRLTKAAQLVCESYTGIVFTLLAIKMQCDNWQQTMEIPEVSSISSISSIKYMDDADPSVQQTWSAADYYLASVSQRSRISLKPGSSYPSLRGGIGDIEIRMDAKPPWNIDTTTDLSEVAVQAVLITISDMYENRQSVVVGRIASRIPKTAEYLLNTLKVQTL